jgi:hypothetical protein
MKLKTIIFCFSFQVNLLTQFFVLDIVIRKLKNRYRKIIKRPLNIGGPLTVSLMTKHWVDPMMNCIA